MNDISQIEVPILATKPWYRRLSSLIAAVIVALILSTTASTIALVTVNSARTDLQNQLTCRAAPAVVVDQKTGDELAAIGVALATNGAGSAATLQALADVTDLQSAATKNDYDAIIAAVPKLVADIKAASIDLAPAAAALAAAVQARADSIDTCK